jgi:hypothetical protein
MLPLTSFLDELAKIAAFANAMLPPSSGGAANTARLPGPSRVPNIDPSGAMSANYMMHMPTVMADMEARAKSGVQPAGTAARTIPAPAGSTPKTIPAPAAALPHPTMPAPSPGRLGASMPQVPFKGTIASLPTVRPTGFSPSMGAAVGKLTKPLGGVLRVAHVA